VLGALIAASMSGPKSDSAEDHEGSGSLTDLDVVVVGAGPTGLMLAGELGQAGIRTLFLERRQEPAEIAKAGGQGAALPVTRLTLTAFACAGLTAAVAGVLRGDRRHVYLHDRLHARRTGAGAQGARLLAARLTVATGGS
jgi:2-polyprenyl-6-methoxyphenol hydroxylase-like FAD-dependent oxidoreductase